VNPPVVRTGRWIVAGTWGCAVIVMAASAANAALTYGALGDNRLLGLATGVAVDIGLCVALIGDRRLYMHGITSPWGRALRITTAAMSLILNTGIAVRDGHLFMALMHAFLPILLVVLTEYGQDVLLQFNALARKEAEREGDLTSDPGPSKPVSGGFGRPGSEHHSTQPWSALLGHSGVPAGLVETVLPAPGGLDLPVSPPGVGPIEVSQPERDTAATNGLPLARQPATRTRQICDTSATTSATRLRQTVRQSSRRAATSRATNL
jgi:hypothetical protein